MKRRTFYQIHKWLGIIAGFFLLIQAVSGISLILPSLSPMWSLREWTLKPADFQNITVSPPEAVATALADIPEASAKVERVTLKRILNVIIYEVFVKSYGPRLVDAQSGQIFTMTPEFAEQIVRDAFPSQSRIHRIERIDRHDLSYVAGPLPAYRIAFADDPSVLYHVSMTDGKVVRRDRLNRIRAVIERLHFFEEFKFITEKERILKILPSLLAAIGILAIGVGYYLALPQRWRIRNTRGGLNK
jgi:hypothetical protein